MAAHYFETVEDTVTGKPVANASVSVLTAPTADGGTALTIYTNEALSDQADNPLTTDSTGYFEFYTDQSECCLEVAYNGTTQRVIENVNLIGGSVSGDVTALQVRMDNLDTLLGTAANATDLGTFSGSTISDNDDLLGALQSLETAVEAIAVPAEASASEIWTGTETAKYISPDKIFDAAAFQTLTDGATITPNFGAGLNFKVTLAGNRTLANPSNAKDGQSGVIRVIQDGTGSRTLAYGSNWRFPGGAASGGVLSTAASSIDIIAYVVGEGGLIYATLSKAFAA